MSANPILSRAKEVLDPVVSEEAFEAAASSREKPEFTVVVPICERHDDLEALCREYGSRLQATGRSFEFLFVVDGAFGRAFERLSVLKKQHPEIRIIRFNRNFGESAALTAGFEEAAGRIILTLSPYFQVEPAGIDAVIEKIGEGYDLVITRRHPRIDSRFNRIQSRVFHWLNEKLTGMRYQDMSCGLRAMTRGVAREIHLYGDLHRFIPLLASRQGFKIAEVDVPQSLHDAKPRVYGPGVYLRRLLDILTVFFLFKFTKKPLRFFGLIGSALFLGGSLITAYLGLYRILGYGGIADRPLLLLGVLLMVLGVQTLSLGFIGEIIIFTHARKVRDYAIDKVMD